MVQRRAGDGLFPAGTMRNCLLLAGIFAVSRLIYFAAGVRFLVNLSNLLQVADLSLLRDDLYRTVLLLHFQPPLFNLFVGLVLKLAPVHYALVFQIVYLLFGLALVVAIYLLAIRLGLTPRRALVLVGLFAVTPATVLLENWAFYTYPDTLLLVLAALSLNLFLESGRLTWLFALFLLAMILVLTRSMFHPLWLLVIAAALFVLLPGRRRQVTAAALVPLLVAGLWMAKNYYTVGSFTTVTQLGMHFSNITIMQLSGQERVRMYTAGELSALGLYAPFKELEFYRENAGPVPNYLPTGIPIMDNEHTGTGFPNFNNPAYVDISRRYLKDDLSVIRHHPGAYAHGVLGALCLYFQPPHDQIFSFDNAERIAPVMRVFDVLLYGQLSSLFYDNFHVEFKDRIVLERNMHDLGLFVLAVFLAVIIFWPAYFLGLKQESSRSARGLTIWFMYCNLAYVTVMPNLFVIGENARIRYVVEPFLWLLFALFLDVRAKHSEAVGAGE